MKFSAVRNVVCVFSVIFTAVPALASIDGQAGFYSSFLDRLFSQEEQLLHVTSDAMPGYTDIHLELDSSANIVGMRRSTDNGDMQEFSLSQLASGAVLLNQSGYDVVKIVTENLDPHSGGVVRMVYLSNAITSSYENYDMDLVPQGSQWSLEVNDQSGHHSISNMFLKGRTLFGKVIGIESVSVN